MGEVRINSVKTLLRRIQGISNQKDDASQSEIHFTIM